jgi:hypothetical protein
LTSHPLRNVFEAMMEKGHGLRSVKIEQELEKKRSLCENQNIFVAHFDQMN